MAGVKYIDFTELLSLGDIQVNGVVGDGESALTVDAAQAAVASASAFVADTIGDPLGIDTRANFPNASISILTNDADVADGTDGSDLIASLDGVDTVNGLAGNDKILGGSGIDTLIGGDGNDHLYGFAANDTLNGGDGADKLVGGLGDDTLLGGAGDDEIQAQTGNDTLYSGAGADVLLGGLGDDAITVDGSGNKTIDGGPGDDTLTIRYGSITGISDFSVTSADGQTTLTDADGNQITFRNIETLVIGDATYIGVYAGVRSDGIASSLNLNESAQYTDPTSSEANFVPGARQPR